MKQYDLHYFAAASDNDIQLLLVLQTDLIDLGAIRVVAPCYFEDRYGPRIDRLNPIFDFNGKSYLVAIQELLSITEPQLGPKAGTAPQVDDDIKRALDFLFSGF